MRILIMCFGLFVIVGCHSPTTNNNKLNTVDSLQTKSQKINENIKNGTTLIIDTIGFLNNCKLLLESSEVRTLQGTNASKDSIVNLGFADCYMCSKTFEIIFVHKGGVENRKVMDYHILQDDLKKGCDNGNFSEFDCYAFVAPMRDPEKQEDIHAMNIDFPVTVKAYQRINNDNWHLVKVLKVKTFEEYATLQFKTIYGLKE